MIADYNFWLNTLLLGIGTFAIRGSIISFSSKIKISLRTREIFSFIPAAILPALALPSVFFHQGSVELLHGKERLFILILAALICAIFRSMLVTIIFGMGTLYLITQILT